MLFLRLKVLISVGCTYCKYMLIATSLLNILYAIPSPRLLVQKKDVTIFDFLILFSTMYFGIIPLLRANYLVVEDDIVLKVFVFYNLFMIPLFLTSFFWRVKYGNINSIINVTKFLSKIGSLRNNLLYYVIVSIFIFVILTVYMPNQLRTVSSDYMNQSRSYGQSSLFMLLGGIITVTNLLVSLKFCIELKYKELHIVTVVFLVFLSFLMMFFPRRDFLFSLIVFSLFFYSTNREKINNKIVLLSILVGFFLYSVFFPFYNVIRRCPVEFNSSSPVSSLINTINYGIENFNDKKDDAMESTDSRSEGVYRAVYFLCQESNTCMSGALTVAAIDAATPRVINPTKGRGTEGILESMTKKFVDIADSFFLLAYGEFMIMGGVYCFVLYLLVFFITILYSSLFSLVFKSRLLPIFLCIHLVSLVWNIEGKLESALAFFYTSILSVVVLLLIEKFKILYIQNENSIH